MSELAERIGVMGAKIDAAHKRLDKHEVDIKDDLKEIKADLKKLNAYMHKSIGWLAAAALILGALGSVLVKIFL